jgi:hypothetical protein
MATRILIVLAMAGVALLNPLPADAEVRMVSTVPYSDGAEIAENVRRECVRIQEQLAEFTREYAAGNGIEVVLLDEVSSDDPGRVLVVQIEDAVSMGNAFSGHRKFTRISGELFQDGERVAGFRGRRNSGGGAFGGYKGSCSVLGRTVKVLGRDVANWLNNPTDGARLGDM